MKPIVVFFAVLALTAPSLACKGKSKRDCGVSTRGFACMKQLDEYFFLHWTLNEELVTLGLEGIESEWVALSFPKKKGKMVPADAVLGWTDINGPFLEAYRIVEYNIFNEDIDNGVTLLSKTVTQVGSNTFVSFTRDLRQGTVKINPDAAVDINYAVGAEDRLVFHGDRKGSTTVCFAATVPKGQPSPPPPSPVINAEVEPPAAPPLPIKEAETPAIPPAPTEEDLLDIAETPTDAIASEMEEEEEAHTDLKEEEDVVDDLNRFLRLS